MENRMINFCTLFDSYYLDKGIALYKSLERKTNDFCLFVFCFDDGSYEVLKELNFHNMKLIKEIDIQTPILLEKKKERSRAEYCWTCTPIIIEYVLNNYEVESCTYIDSDLYFFANPKVLIEEIESNNADACIVPHRFNDDRLGKKLESRSGKYCVEFNYFRNNENGLRILNWWKNKCLDWCFDVSEEDRMGDQKYLSFFKQNFNNVYELKNLGGGVAPWNLKQYRFLKTSDNNIILKDAYNNEFELIFYHFQNIRYFNRNIVNIKSMTDDKELKYRIYLPYLMEIEIIRKMLIKKFDISYNASRLDLSSNALLGYLQKNFAAFKVRYMSDIIFLDKIFDSNNSYIKKDGCEL